MDCTCTCSDLFSERPRFESPLISGVQGFRVEECDHEDSPHFGESERGEIKECSRLLGGNFPQSSEGRRKFFSKKENLEKYYFEKHYSKLKVSTEWKIKMLAQYSSSYLLMLTRIFAIIKPTHLNSIRTFLLQQRTLLRLDLSSLST